jgi:hypothetical protein
MISDVFYLVEPRAELIERLRTRVEPDFADLLLEPRLYRCRHIDRDIWFPQNRLVQTKLLFMAALREYSPISEDEGFANAFGSAMINVELFDRWYTVRFFFLEGQLEELEPELRDCLDQVQETGDCVVDKWLAELRERKI